MPGVRFFGVGFERFGDDGEGVGLAVGVVGGLAQWTNQVGELLKFSSGRGGLPDRQHLVPGEGVEGAAGLLGVAGGEEVAAGEAGAAGDRGEVGDRVRRVGRLRPHRGHVAEVGERVADRRHLPVEDRGEARGGGGDHHVAEPVVAVDDGRGRRLGQVGGEPVGHRLEVGQRPGRVRL